MNSEAASQFASVDKLRQILVYVLYVSLALFPAALIFDVIQYDLIVALRDHTLDPLVDVSASTDASDRHQTIMGYAQAAIDLIFLVIWFVWVFKSNKLARALGATRMQYSPGWSIGWYFIPIANIFKPFLAMRELYMASMSPGYLDMSSEQEEMPGSLHVVTLWWLFWLADGWVGRIVFKYSLKAEAMDELVFVSKLNIFAELLNAASAVFCVLLVKLIWRAQSESFTRLAAEPLPQAA